MIYRRPEVSSVAPPKARECPAIDNCPLCLRRRRSRLLVPFPYLHWPNLSEPETKQIFIKRIKVASHKLPANPPNTNDWRFLMAKHLMQVISTPKQLPHDSAASTNELCALPPHVLQPNLLSSLVKALSRFNQ